jgi:hypothetical protein
MTAGGQLAAASMSWYQFTCIELAKTMRLTLGKHKRLCVVFFCGGGTCGRPPPAAGGACPARCSARYQTGNQRHLECRPGARQHPPLHMRCRHTGTRVKACGRRHVHVEWQCGEALGCDMGVSHVSHTRVRDARSEHAVHCPEATGQRAARILLQQLAHYGSVARLRFCTKEGLKAACLPIVPDAPVTKISGGGRGMWRRQREGEGA